MRKSVDVLVVGAGPVGLLLATELFRDGVDTLLVERMRERSFFCKALGVTVRSLEIFADLGLIEDAIDAGVWLGGVTAFDNGAIAGTMDIPTEGLPYGSLSLAQFETERLLEMGLRRHGGAVQYGWVLTGFTEDKDGVLARVEGVGGEAREIHCRWLVGCDGAHSAVRTGLGLSFEGGKYPQTFMLADLDVSWDLPRGRAYCFIRSDGSQGPASLVAIPVHGSLRRYRLSTILPETATSFSGDEPENAPSPDLDRVTAIMAPMLPPGTRLAGLRWSSTYRVSHRIVPAYSRGRVFLAGDAAHIHPPVGGQGMNTGLQDAHNLAWKLALAARGRAAPALLDSYSAERHPVGLDVVGRTSRAMDAVIAQKAALPGMHETQLLIGYRGSPIVQDDRPTADESLPMPGDRAPDAGALRRPFVARPLCVHERLGRGRHVLIGYAGDDGGSLDALADMLAVLHAALGATASGFAIAAPGATLPGQERLPVLTDAEGAFRASNGAAPGMAWLIRPDGHIGWCGTTPAELGVFLGRIVRSDPDSVVQVEHQARVPVPASAPADP